MSHYRQQLPQLSDQLFLTDGGLETTLIFREGLHLPEFAAFDLLQIETGTQALFDYFRTYAVMARNYHVGLVLESPTWRANADWGTRLGYDRAALATANQQAIALLHRLRQQYETTRSPMVISGCIGPRGDGYVTSQTMTPAVAQQYHQAQVDTFQATAADLVSAVTMTDVDEAIGITWAAQAAGMPVVISFTVETDGHLPSGQTLEAAIKQVDRATHNGPAYYMINCAHPTHFAERLTDDAPWRDRIRGLRANASTKSHAELDAATELDSGNPTELGQHYQLLKTKLPNLNILGGCCGTDERHVNAICQACLPLFWAHLGTLSRAV